MPNTICDMLSAKIQYGICKIPNTIMLNNAKCQIQNAKYKMLHAPK